MEHTSKENMPVGAPVSPLYEWLDSNSHGDAVIEAHEVAMQRVEESFESYDYTRSVRCCLDVVAVLLDMDVYTEEIGFLLSCASAGSKAGARDEHLHFKVSTAWA